MKKILLILFNMLIFLNMYSYQIEKTFPVSKEDFDDSILTNEMFEFKAFKNQGYIVLEYDEFKNVDIYINGIRLKTDDHNGKNNVFGGNARRHFTANFNFHAFCTGLF